MISNFIEIFTTYPDKQRAEDFGEFLVKNRLAACCQVYDSLSSIYSWEGKVLKEKEFLLGIKTRTELYKTIEDEIRKQHPYEIPQIISVEIINISDDYRIWLDKNIKYL